MMPSDKALSAVSLFASGGIGDLALRAAGANLLVANELIPERADLLAQNFPETEVIIGDIAQKYDEIIKATQKLLHGQELDVLFATPPCQGMSKNGRGKLLQGIRAGLKPPLDQRNQLIIDVVRIARELKPRLIVLENVPEMEQTLIQYNGAYVPILDFVIESLDPQYIGRWKVVEFADYGVPQRRQRLISVFSRDHFIKASIGAGESLFPPPTHSPNGGLFGKKWVSVLEAIGHLPALDASNSALASSTLPYHCVPVLDEDKYFWVSNTPPGKGAFDNQCVNPSCRHQNNPTHGSKSDGEGINRARIRHYSSFEFQPLRASSALKKKMPQMLGKHP